MDQNSDKIQLNDSESLLRMKKGILIILAVALLGATGVYSKNHNQSPVGVNPTSTPSPNTQASKAVSSSAQSGGYKDGTYKGITSDTPYGPVQITVSISSGRITDISFLQMPSDMGHSREITAAAEPLLKETTLQVQSANIDFVSGATSTSYGYEESLQAALNQAKIS